MDPFKILAELIVQLISKFRITADFGLVGVQIKLVSPLAKDQIDERLNKIEIARQSLTEALEAMDDLKNTAETNKADLAKITVALEQAEIEKENLTTQLATLKEIAALDSSSVRKALGLPSAVEIWRERLIAFMVGIVASIVATFAWENLIKSFL